MNPARFLRAGRPGNLACGTFSTMPPNLLTHPGSKHLRVALPFLAALFLSGTAFAGTAVYEKPAPVKADDTPLDLFSLETTFTGRSNFRDATLGKGDSLYSDFSYDRRFPISGHWYFRTGVEYERFDFGGSDNGLPNHLQAMYARLGVDYVVNKHARAGFRIEPGYYFENRIRSDAFNVPWKIWMTFPIQKDKVFGVIGAGGSLYQDPIVVPGGGIIWLINDQWRLQGVFPKPALVYNPNEDWEFQVYSQIVYGSFRTDDVQLPGQPLLHNAVVQYSEYRGGVQASYTGFKPFEIFVGGGYTFQREFDFYRADRRERLEGAPYVKCGVSAKF